MRWRPPAHPCPVASSFFIAVLIACRMGGLGGRFHVCGWALCWYVICVADCGICDVITAIYVFMCMFVVKCICVWEWAQTKVALCFYFWRHGFWSLTVPEAHGITNEPMIRDPPYLCSPQCLPPSCHTRDAHVHDHTQLLHAVGRQVSELRTSCLYSKCLNNWISW